MRGGGLREVVSRIGECWWWTGIPVLATACCRHFRHWRCWLAAPAAGVVVAVLIGGVGSTSSYWCRCRPRWWCWFAAAAAGVVVGGVSRLWQQQSSLSLWQQQQLLVSSSFATVGGCSCSRCRHRLRRRRSNREWEDGGWQVKPPTRVSSEGGAGSGRESPPSPESRAGGW